MKKSDSYTFPAVLTYEKGYDIAVTFPDFPGCATSGTDEADAIAQARGALGGRMWCMEQDKEAFPAPSPLRSISLEQNECAVLVDVYMPSIRLAQENRAVTRTVTIPAWLNAASVARGVNFSQLLQSALMRDLGLSKRV